MRKEDNHMFGSDGVNFQAVNDSNTSLIFELKDILQRIVNFNVEENGKCGDSVAMANAYLKLKEIAKEGLAKIR
jgi:hypothetical protein